MRYLLLITACLSIAFSGCAWLSEQSEKVLDAQVLTLTNEVTGEVAAITNAWDVKPGIDQTLDTARTLNNTMNPTPSAPIVEMALGGLSSLLAMLAAWKTRQAQRERQALESVILGVERYGSDAVKTIIKDTALNLGAEPVLHKRVAAITKLP